MQAESVMCDSLEILCGGTQESIERAWLFNASNQLLNEHLLYVGHGKHLSDDALTLAKIVYTVRCDQQKRHL